MKMTAESDSSKQMTSIHRFLRRASEQFAHLNYEKLGKMVNKYRSPIIAATTTCTTLYLLHRSYQKRSLEIKTAIKRRTTEKRFIGFASAVYKGQLFMTPLDFVESVLEDEPRKRHRRTELTDQKLIEIQNNTPRITQGSSKFFRNLRDNGLISYSEYLFLLSVLVKPHSAFTICFTMLDADNSGSVDKDEYLVMERIFGQHIKSQKGISVEKSSSHEEHLVNDEDGLQQQHQVDTTLIVHFFGLDGNDVLSFEAFQKFMLDFQKEVLEIEFSQFSRGLDIIKEVDFAKILLKYTHLEKEQYDEYIDRLVERIEMDGGNHPGITFEEFSSFMQFLHSLNEFNLVMKFYTLANAQASEFEFRDAVKVCTGINFSMNLVKALFNLFDVDGDGNLSYNEFNFIMRDRVHRGLSSTAKKGSIKAFKLCVRREMLRQHTASFYQSEEKE